MHCGSSTQIAESHSSFAGRTLIRNNNSSL